MSKNEKTPVSLMARFRRDESGSATFEALLWVPFFLFLLIALVDAMFLFKNKARVERILQDGNRQYVLGAFEDEANSLTALENWIKDRIVAKNLAGSVTATASIDNSILETVVSYPSSSSVPLKDQSLIGNLTMSVAAYNLTE